MSNLLEKTLLTFQNKGMANVGCNYECIMPQNTGSRAFLKHSLFGSVKFCTLILSADFGIVTFYNGIDAALTYGCDRISTTIKNERPVFRFSRNNGVIRFTLFPYSGFSTMYNTIRMLETPRGNEKFRINSFYSSLDQFIGKETNFSLSPTWILSFAPICHS